MAEGRKEYNIDEGVSAMTFEQARTNPLMSPSLKERGVMYYEKVDSTNVVAKTLARSGRPHMTAVLSEEQEYGRGRRGRSWLSRPGVGAWMSLIVRPKILPQRAPELVIVTAVALWEALASLTGNDTRIKWPNDVHYGSDKICGTLLELGGIADPDKMLDFAVIGVGINVLGHDFPADLPEAASIESAMGVTLQRANVVECFLDCFERTYDQWLAEGLDAIMPKYRAHSSTLGARIKALCPDGERIGVAEDIAEDGALMLRMEDGSLERLYAGDVSIRGI